MTMPIRSHSAEPEPDATARRRRWFRVQLSLRTLVLLVAAFAVWTSYGLDRGRIARLNDRIARSRPLVRELVIDDDQKIAVVRIEPLWMDENRWDVYLPEGTSYRLCLATQDIDQNGLAPEFVSEPLSPGRHSLSLEQIGDGRNIPWNITAILDGGPRLTIEEPAVWNPNHGSSGGGQFDQSSQLPEDEPVVLFRRRFMQSNAPNWTVSNGPTEGILLWIEPAPQPSASSGTRPTPP